MHGFKSDSAKLAAQAIQHADRIGHGLWRVLLGVALVVLAWNAGPDVGRLLLWAVLKFPA